MNYDTVKVKLHDYIEHADHEKVMAIYTLVNNEAQATTYDDATIAMLETRRNDMVSGKEKTYTLEQTVENLLRHHNRNGI